jgi:hypothetical protein
MSLNHWLLIVIDDQVAAVSVKRHTDVFLLLSPAIGQREIFDYGGAKGLPTNTNLENNKVCMGLLG